MNTPSDEALIESIKSHQNVAECLRIILDRHSGIYFDIINKLVPDNSLYCSKRDLHDDRILNIYNAVLKFNPNKGTKFSTFLGNETKWICLNSYNKAKKKPLFSKDPESLDSADKVDDSEVIDHTLLKEVFTLLSKNADWRAGKIFKMRYTEGEGNKSLAWKHVAPHVGLSIQGCINVHDTIIQDLKRKLKPN
jgi:DNA-directed RNA polymerase specialized sigma subunit